MKMLNSPHALQFPPIPKPNHVPLPTANSRKGLSNKVFNLASALRQQIIRDRVRGKGEFRPDDEVHDARVEAVGPVVGEDFVVFFGEEG